MSNRKSLQLTLLYLLSYIIMLVSSIIYIYNIPLSISGAILKICIIFSLILNLMIFIFRHNKIGNYMYFFVLLFSIFLFLMGEVLNFHIISIRLLIILTLLLNVDLLDVKKFVYVTLFSEIVMLILAFILNLVNILPNTDSYKGLSMGFNHPNLVGSLVLSIIVGVILLLNNGYVYNIHHNFQVFIPFLCLFLVLFFFYLSKCRGLLYSGLIILLFIFLRHIKFINSFMTKYSIPLEVLIIILSVICVYKFNPLSQSWNVINNLFSHRLSMQYMIVHAQPIKLYGQHISSFVINEYNNGLGVFSSNYWTVDNFYLATAYHYGIIGLFLIMIIFFRISFLASKYKYYIPCVLLLSLIIYSFIEGDAFSCYNITPILYIEILAHHKKFIS